jgi:membrane protein insertase Oxa1/YidC/SpoIIIJ
MKKYLYMHIDEDKYIYMYNFHTTVKAVTLPLTTAQLESTTKMQKLTPLQKRIQERFADDEPTKNVCNYVQVYVSVV